MQQLETLIVQQVCFMISQIHDNPRDGNKSNHAGIREVTAAQIHAGHYYLKSFMEAVDTFKGCPEANKLVTAVGVLFGINQAVGKSFALVQMGLDPDVLRSLQVCKERILKDLRQSLLTLIDGIGLPDGIVRSHITGENLYEDLLEKARNGDLNK